MAAASPTLAALVPWALGPDAGDAGSLRGWLRSLVEAHESQRLPDVLVRNVRRFADSLGEVLDVAWARLGLEGEEGGRGSLGSGPKKLVKALHVGWSTMAYTLLLDVVNRNAAAREGGGGSGAADASLASASGGAGAGGAEQQDREQHRRQLLAAVGALAALANDGHFLDLAVTRPLGRLLAGAPLVPSLVEAGPSGSSSNPREDAMRALSLALVLEHDVVGDEGAAEGLPLIRLRTLHRARRAHGEPGIVEAWPLLERPLLAHDLSTLAVGALSLARQEAGPARRLAQLLALARLAQALLEPWTPPPAPGEVEMDADSGASSVGLAWARWRRLLLRSGHEEGGGGGMAALEEEEEAEADKAVAPALERAVLSRWRPFLQLLLGLLDAFGLPLSEEEAAAPSPAGSSGTTVPQLLARLSLRLEDTSGEEVRPLFAAWAQQYRAFARRVPYLWEEDGPQPREQRDEGTEAVQLPVPVRTPSPVFLDDAEGSEGAGEEDEVEEDEGDDEASEGESVILLDDDDSEDDAEMDVEEVEDGEPVFDFTSSPPPPPFPLAPGPPTPFAYHCAPYLSLLDGSATAADAQGQWMPTPTDSSGAAVPLYDLSHLGVSDEVALRLVALPQHYTELYTLLKEQYWALSATHPGGVGAAAGAVGAAGGGGGGGGGALTSGPTRGLEDPAICLVCGAVLAAGPRMQGRARLSGPGVCTLHARACGSGTGVMLLMNKGSSLLFRDARAIFYPSVFVDEYGEDDPNLRRGRPLSLSQARYDRLTQLYRQHGAAKEVTGRRLTADRVVRENYY